jgi:hypothetical protein
VRCKKPCPLCPPIATAKADLRNGDVCFTPESGHVQCTGSCLLRANSGHFAAPGKGREAGCASRDRCGENAQQSLCSSGTLAAGSGTRTRSQNGGGINRPRLCDETCRLHQINRRLHGRRVPSPSGRSSKRHRFPEFEAADHWPGALRSECLLRGLAPHRNQ